MARQWRVACEECGKPELDYLRMHTEIRRNPPLVECNLCENRTTVQEPSNESDDLLPGQEELDEILGRD